MATAPLIHVRYSYASPIVSRKNVSEQGPIGSFSNGSSSFPCSSSSSSSNTDSSYPSGTNSRRRHQGLRARSMSTTTQGQSLDRSIGNTKNDPDHLLVHGILASPSDWIYAEGELKRRLGKNFLIYVSSSNTYTKTFTGIDGAGKRFAEEVMQVVEKTKSLKRISFLVHSLGGLFARYAIAVLYSPNANNCDQPNDLENCKMESSQRKSFSRGGLIAGLEPINFITLATPHLCLGKKADCSGPENEEPNEINI